MIRTLSSLPAGVALGLMLGAGGPHPRAWVVAGLVLASAILWVWSLV